MNHKQVVLYGVAVWTFVFIIALLAFPLRAEERPLFESIMPVALALAVTSATVKYFQSAPKKTAMIGFCLGLIWLIVSLLLDSLLFFQGPMKMTLADYLKDIGVTYLLILVIPTGFGFLLGKK